MILLGLTLFVISFYMVCVLTKKLLKSWDDRIRARQAKNIKEKILNGEL